MTMPANKIMQDISAELKKSKKKHPNWPDHVAAQAGIVSKEAGELMKASLEWKYEKSVSEIVEEVQVKAIYDEAVQVAATAIRFLENLKINACTK